MQRYRHTDVEDFVARLQAVGLPSPTQDEMQLANSRQLLAAFADGRFADALPYPFYDHLMTWVKEQIVGGEDQVVICLATEGGGAISFLYDVVSAPEGLLVGPAIDYAVPQSESDRDFDFSMLGKPSTIVDVSALRKTTGVASTE